MPSGRILVVDDDSDVGLILEAALTRRDYEVAVACSVQEARDALAESSFDLALIDLRLGDDDGLAFARSLPPGLTAVIMSGEGDDDSVRDAALRNGASGYIAKPISLSALFAEVGRALSPR